MTAIDTLHTFIWSTAGLTCKIYKKITIKTKIMKPMKSKSSKRKSTSTVESMSANSLKNGAEENHDPLGNRKNAATQHKTLEPSQSDYKVGHLVWAQVSHHPYWPSIVIPDPDTNKYIKWKSFGRQINACMIHAGYFGDRGRHNWAREPSLMPFTGLSDFQKLHDEWQKLPNAVKRKDPKLITGYASKVWHDAKWNLAVKEAEQLLPMMVDERLKAIQPDVSISLEGETLTPPLSHKNSNDESEIFPEYKTPRIRGAKKIKRTSSKVASFDVFSHRRKDALANLSPDSTEADIRTDLLKSRKNMSDKARQKYRAKRRRK